ncbi:cytochrome c552 [Tistrella bauzanensis]|uniref:Cytochrome c552 n=1 Tax=Tistrella bauzanensis TaxID=657419 RepID=A0ABQ1I8J3_9PROT|nr:c-type cytochrome [Tistrella bauzanensis]GGB27451.1 cytochrome c552 [Tistrella bauzanensis]
MKIHIRHLASGLAVLAAVVTIGLWIGLMPISASSGHWRVTSWFLHWVMQNSVQLNAMSVEEPAIVDDPVLVRRAAGHFEASCRFCHGAPGKATGPVPYQMTPAPPGLDNSAHAWAPAELFTIVKHGVKFSGMPAWPAPPRDDEVWAMVAFLRALPDMDEAGYDRLRGAAAPGAAGEAGAAGTTNPVLAGCVACHGIDGGSDGGAFPVIGGQSADYLATSLAAYRDGRRASGIMQLAASGLSDDEIARLARHYAGQRPQQPAQPAAAPDDIRRQITDRGGAIAAEGLPDQRVPACGSCHGGVAVDGAITQPRPGFPRLTGQDRPYLETQLHLWRAGARGGGSHAHLMARAAHGLTDADIAAVAAFYADDGNRGTGSSASR